MLAVINNHIAQCLGEERKGLVVMGKAVPLRGPAEGHGRGHHQSKSSIDEAMRLQALIREIPKIESEGSNR